MKKLNSITWISLIFVILLFNYCGCTKKEENQPKVVGVILATTGKADFIGKPEKNVLEKLLQDHNDNNQNPFGIELKYSDSGGEPGKALTLFNKFAEDKNVIAIIGPSTSGESILIAKKANEEQIPLLSLAASKKIVFLEDGSINKWVYKFAQNDDLAAERLAMVIMKNKHKKLAFLYSDDGFGKSGAEVFKEAAKNSNFSIIHSASFPSSIDSPEPFVEALPNDLDAIMIWGTAPGPALLVKTLKSKRFKGKIYLSHGNASESFIESTGIAGEGSIIVGSRVLTTDDNKLDEKKPSDAVIIRFRSFWHKNFTGTPSHFGGHARDALEAIFAVLPNVDLKGDIKDVRSSIRQNLEKLSHHYGVTGTFNFSPEDHAGLNVEAFETYLIENGKFVPYR